MEPGSNNQDQETAMKTLPLALAALSATLIAQEMPDPRHKEHDALKPLVGSWETVMKMEAMPGVPGMEKPMEAKGIERAELVCNGLWLKSVIDSTWKGGPFQGIWLAGYDPFAKKYRSYWVSSDDQEGLAVMDGTFDEKSKTWTWSGDTPHGAVRSTFVLKDADNSVETCYLKTPDGKESKCMEITRKRSKSPAAIEASAKVPAAKLTKEHELLHQDIGVWEATILAAAAPGQQPTAEKGTESIVATCNGLWSWSDFKGQMMGAPFEGHALVGFDANEKKYVSVWIDSMSAVAAKTVGTFDEAKKAFTFTGSCNDPTGKPMSIHEVLTWKDADTRVLKMEFKTASETHNMEITYKRKTKG
jgi:hypothetical protein